MNQLGTTFATGHIADGHAAYFAFVRSHYTHPHVVISGVKNKPYGKKIIEIDIVWLIRLNDMHCKETIDAAGALLA